MNIKNRGVRSVVRTPIPHLTEHLIEHLFFVTNVTHLKLSESRGGSRKPKLTNNSPNCSLASKNIPHNGSPSRSMVYFYFRLPPLPCSYANTPAPLREPCARNGLPRLSCVLIHKTCSLFQSNIIHLLTSTK